MAALQHLLSSKTMRTTVDFSALLYYYDATGGN